MLRGSRPLRYLVGVFFVGVRVEGLGSTIGGVNRPGLSISLWATGFRRDES